MAGENSGAMFYFDTNIDRVASDITAGLARINAKLSEPLKLNSQGLSSQSDLLQGFGRNIESEMDRRIQALREKVSTGLKPREIRAEFQRSLGGFFDDIPTMLANGLGRMPASAANSAPVKQYAQELARSFHSATRAALSEDPRVATALSRSRFPLAAYNQLGRAPVAFGQETDPMAHYRNILRAEGFLRRDPALGADTRKLTQAAGFTDEYMKALQKDTVRTVKGTPRFTPTDAADRIRDLRLEASTVEEREKLAARAKRIDDERTARQQADVQRRGNLQAQAQRIDRARTQADEEAVQRRGQLMATAERMDQTRTAGQERDTRKTAGQQMQAQGIDQQMENARRLTENWGSVVPVGQYRILGQEVYRLSEFGATRITEENRVREALEGQARVMQQQLQMAERQLAAAQRGATAEARTGARNEGRQGGVLQGFFNKFSGNQGQTVLNNVGSHIASAAQFSVGYGALFGLQHALKDTVHEYLDYQDSMTDLQVATRETGAVTDQWVNSLSDVARITGENVGASLDSAARGVRAFASPLNTSKEELQAIGSAASDAAAKLALISGKPLADATGDLLAVGTSFGFQPDQLDQVVDAVANAKRLLGGDPGQISQGLASIATSAQTSGFNVDQAADLVSLVQSRTDQSGQAVATRLTRIFQTMSGTTGKSLGLELGVDTNKSTREQLLGPGGYAQIYNDPNTSKTTKDRISSQLAGTANLREFLAVMDNAKDLSDAFGESQQKAGGATDEFNRKTRSLRGTLTTLVGDISHIQTNLGRTDLGAPFAYAVYAAEPLLHLLNRLLELIDVMPKQVKLIGGAFADVLVAAKAVQVVSNVRAGARVRGGILSGGPGARIAENDAIVTATEARAAAEAAYIEAVTVATEARVAVEGAEDAAIVGATGERVAAEAAGAAGSWTKFGPVTRGGEEAVGKMGFLGGLGRIARFLTNPVTLGVGAVVGAGYLTETALDARDQRRKNAGIEADTSASYLRVTGTSTSLGTAIRDLQNAAGRIEKSDSNFMSGQDQHQRYDDLRGQIKNLEVLQRRVSREENAAASVNSINVFGDGGVITSLGQLQDGLVKLADAGSTARQQLGAVESALLGLATPASGQQYAPESLSSTAATTVFGALRDALPKGKTTIFGDPYLPPNGPSNAGGPIAIRPKMDVSRTDAYNVLANDNNVTQIADAYKSKARQLGIKEGDVLTSQQRQQLARAAADALDLSSIVDPRERRKIRDAALKIVLQQIAPQTQQDKLLNGKGALSSGEVQTLFKPSEDGKYAGLDAMHQAAVSSIPKTDDGHTVVNVNRRYVRLLKSLQTRAGGVGQVAILDDAVKNAEDEYARSAVTRMEMLRKHAQNKKGLSKAELKGMGTGWLTKEINASINDTAYLIELMNSADLQVLAVVRASLVRAKRIADAAAASARTFHSHAQAEVAAGGISGNPAGATGGRTAAQKKADAALDQYDKAASEASPPPKGSNYATGADAGRGDARKKADEKKKKKAKDDNNDLTAAQEAARLAAARVDPDRTIRVAQIALQSARADLAAVKPKDRHTDAYYSALKAVHDAKEGLAQAEADHASAIASAQGARVGGGLATARAQIHAAAIGLHQMTKGTTGWWNALGEYYNAQQAMRDAIASYRANQDKLHGDMTDPVENARDALRAARRQLRLDRGRGRDIRTADRVAVREGAAGLDSARFQQRMSDMQTADELGRISHQKYLQYLDHEHDRLTRIHKRTRQQQDELDTVDKAMKEAKTAMDSQFNLGDINTRGLVYQVRRFKAEASAQVPTASANNTTHQTVSISINGADTAKVKTIIDGYLRIQGGQRQALTRRKV